MNSEKTQELYTKAVFWFADHCPEGWYKAQINIEILLEKEELATNWQVRSFKSEDERDPHFEPPVQEELELTDIFEEIFYIANDAGEAWTVCDFTVYNTGKYEVNYSYDEPPRLSGKDILSGAQ